MEKTITEIITPFVNEADQMKAALVAEQTKLAEIEERYKSVRLVLKDTVTIELLNERKELEENLKKQAEVVNFYQESYFELCKKMDNHILRNEIRSAAHATIREDIELQEKNEKLKDTLKNFLSAYDDFLKSKESKINKNVKDIQAYATHMGGGYYGTSLYSDIAHNLPFPKLGNLLEYSQSHCHNALQSGIMPVLKSILEKSQ